MTNCDWNFIMTAISALAAVSALYIFLKGGIEKMIQRHTDTLHKDIMGIKEDLKQTNDRMENAIKEMREDSKNMNARIDRSYQMFVELLTGKPLDAPRTDP